MSNARPIFIKQELPSFSELKIKLKEYVIKMRENDNSQHNCGYLTNSIINYSAYLLGIKEFDEKIAPTKSSLDNTKSYVTEKLVTIKSEFIAVPRKSKHTVTEEAERSTDGLHANLPYEEKILEIDLEKQRSVSTIDLESHTISKKTASNPEELNKFLKNLAKIENKIIYGHIGIARKNFPIGHVFAFVANEDEVIYIDGQLYNGTKKLGDPVFSNLREAVTDNNKRAYDFEDENKKGKFHFQLTCFYLVHGGVKIKPTHSPTLETTSNSKRPVVNTRPISTFNDSDSNIKKTTPILDKDSTVEMAKQLQHQPNATIILNSDVNDDVVDSLPQNITAISFKGADIRKSTLQILSKHEHIKGIGFLSENIKDEIIAAIPSTIHQFDLFETNTENTVKALPTHIRVVLLAKTSKNNNTAHQLSSIALIPRTVFSLALHPTTTPAEAKAIPPNITTVTFNNYINPMVVQSLPSTVTHWQFSKNLLVPKEIVIPENIIAISFSSQNQREIFKAYNDYLSAKKYLPISTFYENNTIMEIIRDKEKIKALEAKLPPSQQRFSDTDYPKGKTPILNTSEPENKKRKNETDKTNEANEANEANEKITALEKKLKSQEEQLQSQGQQIKNLEQKFTEFMQILASHHQLSYHALHNVNLQLNYLLPPNTQVSANPSALFSPVVPAQQANNNNNQKLPEVTPKKIP